jgi:hypothetical protein
MIPNGTGIPDGKPKPKPASGMRKSKCAGGQMADRHQKTEVMRSFFMKGKITEAEFVKSLIQINGKVKLHNPLHKYTRWGCMKLVEYYTPAGSPTWVIIAKGKVLFDG